MTTEIYSLELLEKESHSMRASVRYDPAHPVFAGHFPGNPIVPGVCTLNMITDTLQQHVSAGLSLHSASNVKFLQLIRPDHRPELRLSWTETEAGLDVQATLQLDSTVLMRFAGKYQPA